jgi:alkanesulfonate monooxygenase
MVEWFSNDAADGFILQPAFLPGALDDFIEQVVPELQNRGVFRTEYEGPTLRENLGLARPANRYVAGARAPSGVKAKELQ